MKSFLLLILLISAIRSTGQTTFWSDNFNDAGAPTSGVRTPSYQGGSGGPPWTRYFARVASTDINSVVAYGNVNGKFWAAEDVDAAPSGTSGQQPSIQNVTWSNIDISGRTQLSFRGRFATPSTTVFDHGTSTGQQDYCIVQYQLNNTGPWITFLSFQPNDLNATTGALAVDTNDDLLGDGTELTASFTSFVVVLPVTGSTISLRCESSINSLQEELAFDEFELRTGALLPVSLISFSGHAAPAGNRLNWSTASEDNNSGFTIERSADARTFLPIGEVAGAGNATTTRHYTFTDNHPFPGTTYYRLKQTDIDGRFEYSNIISIRSDAAGKLKVYPNPVQDKLFIEPATMSPTTSVQLVNASGMITPVQFIRRQAAFEADMSGLPAGTYILYLINGLEKSSTVITKR